MRNWLLRGISLLMAMVLLAGTVCAAEKSHQPVDFDEMIFTPFDEGPLTAALDELEALCGPDCSEDSQSRARTLYNTIVSEYERLDTLHSLAFIHYYLSGTAQEWADAEDTLTEQGTRLLDRIYAALRKLAESPCRGVLDEDQGEELTNAMMEYEDISDEMKRLIQEENRLVQQYDQALAGGAEVTINGKLWTDENLDSADLSVEDYWAVSDKLDEAMNDTVGETFRELIQVRTEIAEEAGYDSYIDYAYSCYNRDYRPKDVQRLRQAVKKYFVPLNAFSYDSYDEDALNDAWESLALEGEALMEAIQPGIASLHPDLEYSYAFMMEHQLYDTDPRPGKLDGGFTTGLGDYGSAYIYNKPYGSYQDCSDMVHEFGHFHQSFSDPTPALWLSSNMDTAEIHSQALQLFYASSADLFGPASDDFFFAILSELVDAVQEGCLYDEFLAEVYADPGLSLDEINAVFKDVSEDYGYYYPDGQDEAWFWVRVPHNFQSPFYYISYAVSALSALDLWLCSLDDWDGALETYMDLTELSQDIPFRAALRETDLTDVFHSSAVRNIAKALKSLCSGEEVKYHQSMVRLVFDSVTYILITAPCLSLLILLAVFLVRRRVRRKSREF